MCVVVVTVGRGELELALLKLFACQTGSNSTDISIA